MNLLKTKIKPLEGKANWSTWKFWMFNVLGMQPGAVTSQPDRQIARQPQTERNIDRHIAIQTDKQTDR